MFADTPVDPRSIENPVSSPPIGMSNFFLGRRFDAWEAKQTPESAPATGWFNAVNPLLLASAISYCIIRKVDYRSFLNRYMAGEELPDLEEGLLAAPEFEDQNTLAAFLDLEERYAESLRLLALHRLLPSDNPELVTDELGPDSTIKLQGSWDALAAGRPPASKDLSKFKVLWFAWLYVNPDIMITGDSKKVRVSFVAYGLKHNSDIHNVRQQAEQKLAEVDAQLNAVLSAEMDKEGKQLKILETRVARENAVKLIRRARRLYEWNPAEIEAHEVESLVHEKLTGQQHEKLRHYGE